MLAWFFSFNFYLDFYYIVFMTYKSDEVLDQFVRGPTYVTILVAFDDSFAIGKDGTIPWHEADDLRLFKDRTMGKTIVMGRKTWDSLPVKPLPGRTNIIISSTLPRSRKLNPQEVWSTSLENAISWLDAHIKPQEVFIVGGRQVYEQALRLADRVLASKIPGVHEADTYFPSLDDWVGQEVEKYEGFTVWEYRKIS
jgi:dihydrofolate reductase